MSRCFVSLTILALVTLGTSRLARADELATPVSSSAEPSVAVTMSPLHLLVPLAEVTAEIRAAPRVGIAVIGGIGAFRDVDTNARVMLYEGGASARYYVAGSFRTGLQLGAEVLYVHASTSATNVDVRAAGLAVSPFVGGKWTHHSGFTTELQLGVSYMAARASADTGTMATRSNVGPLLNMQVGYSF